MAYMETRAAALHYLMYLSSIVAAALERTDERLRDPVRRSALQENFMADGRSHYVILTALQIQLTRIYGDAQYEISRSGTQSTQALWIRVYRQIYRYQLIRPILNNVTGYRFPKIFELVHIHWGSIVCNLVPDLLTFAYYFSLFVVIFDVLYLTMYDLLTFSGFCDIDLILLLVFVYIFIFVIVWLCWFAFLTFGLFYCIYFFKYCIHCS